MTDTSRTAAAARRLFGVTVSDLLKLLIASAVAGVTLRLFGLDPRRLWADFFAALGDFLESWPRALAAVVEGLGPAFSYVVYGAIIVVPVWLAFRVLNAFLGKR